MDTILGQNQITPGTATYPTKVQGDGTATNLLTIPKAVVLGYGKETSLRSKVKKGEVRSFRLWGRVLIERRK